MNLLFTLNKNYIDQLKVCVRSITRFPIEEGWEVYIIIQDSENEFEKLKRQMEDTEGMRVHLIKIDEDAFKDFPETNKYSRVVYYRIFASFILPKNIDRILYLDPDIVVIKPLNQLYNMDFEGNCFIAASHTKEILTEINRVRLGVKNDIPYINSGVMLMNLAELRKVQSEREVIDYVNKKGERFILPDQDIISAVYGEKIKLIDTLKYNISDRLIVLNNLNPLENEIIDMDWVIKNAVIIHYYGDNKPWKEKYKGILDVFYNEVADTIS